MRCLIHVPTGPVHRVRRGRYGRRGGWETFRISFPLETTVYRVALPNAQDSGKPFVLVDAWIPEAHRKEFMPIDGQWIEPEVIRVRAYVHENRKTLAPFLASGLSEMDVREAA